MCGSGLLSTIVTSCQDAFRNQSHPLHLPLTRVFEKLASQAIEPDVLRQFLWLGGSPPLPSRPSKNKTDALSCDSANAAWSKGSEEDTVDNKTDPQTVVPVSSSPWVSKGSTLALQTAMSLISMTSPRHFQLRSAALAPSFVEFDMSMEGYGCLYLPTLATVLGPNAEQSVSGGIGMVSFFPQDRSLVISTEEVEFQALDIMEPEGEVLNPSPFPGQVQFGCGNLLVTGQWHHLTVTVAKEAKKSCIVSAYINAQMLGSAKMQYFQPLPGSCISMEPTSFIDVYGYIATPRIWKQKSSLTWRLGPTYLFEEAISVETIEVINKLGPQYCSNFQAVQLQGEDKYSDHNPTPLVAEEKISFGINATCSSHTTVQDIKNAYNEVDGRLIAKEIGISSRDSSTPIFLAKNIAGHLLGSLRTIGSVAVGQYGVRVFQSSPAATSLNFIGGPAILLGLIAMARDDHTMYAAVKVLNSILNSSPMSEKLMRHMHGYQSYLHSTTVVLGIKLLLCFLHNRLLLNKFKEGIVAGRWLENSSAELSVLMDNLKDHPPVPDNGPFLVFGFSVLQRCVTDHVHIPEIYLLVAGLFLATPQPEPPEAAKKDLESMLQWILQHHLTEDVLKIGLCAEAAVLLLEMVRVTVNKPIADAEASWEIAYPGNIIQFLGLIYHSYTQDPVWHCPDFLRALAMVAFHSGPPKASPEDATSEQKRHFQTKVLLSAMDVFRVASQGEGKTRPRDSEH
ncbi:wd repeat- and fyve domain-containing protein 4 [Limosa lapponica baueri]|uniref:Wd repeat-and fyve domain-containing protein 4 n=1 Tax=Limosa lapponica baueri TaxID=1758121 RepID=A0A2I0TEG6_LIMLA|nr:wd repeat- and fyve domain-containing protein 4 [Limosa lapponica baueri]